MGTVKACAILKGLVTLLQTDNTTRVCNKTKHCMFVDAKCNTRPRGLFHKAFATIGPSFLARYHCLETAIKVFVVSILLNQALVEVFAILAHKS